MTSKFSLRRLVLISFMATAFFSPAQADEILATPDASSPTATADQKVSAKALQLVLDGHEVQAKDLLVDFNKESKSSKNPSAEVLYFLAVFDKRQERAAEAVVYLNRARTLFAKDKTFNDRQMMLLTKRIADCYYSANKPKDALREYAVALKAARAIPDCLLSESEILEGMVAAEMALKNYVEAENYSKTLVALCHRRLENGNDNIIDLLSFSWAQLQESDVFRLSKQTEKLETVRREMRPIIVSFVESRMHAEAAGADYKTIVQGAREQYIQTMKPVTPAEIAWAASDFRVRSLPIVAWKQHTPKPLAAILCIHGMGLENRAFTALAGELNKRGYIVYALDVRGFGSWTQTRGEENLDYPQALADIRNVSAILRSRNPGVPFYVLGESMGGAIALRAGAQLGDVLSGVIASVPSAERFQARKMSLQTAMHFMIDPHRPFDIGASVSEKATSQEKLRAEWRADPKAKLGMTPIELMKFALFMRMTKPQAARITTLPVLMLQGLQDQLVKPQGTFDLFDAIRSTDKTFLTIGKAEHLMFENDSPDPILMDALDSWLRNHCALIPAASGAQSSVSSGSSTP